MDFKTFRKTIDNFFTHEECVGFINFAEQEGFKEALINTKDKGQVMDESIRNNDRHIWQAKDLAGQLWSLLKAFVPQEVDGWRAVGLNEQFRIYRYKDNQEFKVHPDGAFERNEHEHSKLTVIIYLNESFEGGETEFVTPHEIITPKEGRLLLFSHKQLHKGNPVPKGTKYIFRTDVMYTDVEPKPSDKMPNLYDLIAEMDFDDNARTVREAIRMHQAQNLEGEELKNATNQVAFYLVQKFYATLLHELDKKAADGLGR